VAEGLLVVISSPSGGGKTAIIHRMLERPGNRFAYSVSVTTRPRRVGERQGRDYYFVSEEEFFEKIQKGELIEWAEVHGYYYGTPKSPIEQMLSEGKTVLLDLDVYGALAVRKAFPKQSLLIFVRPPSMEILLERLRERRTDSELEIQKRLQRVPEEQAKAQFFDYVITNLELNDTVEDILDIVEKHRKAFPSK